MLKKFSVLLSIVFVYSHPQCLDFQAPFEPDQSNFTFCLEYSSFGCCNNDTSVVAQYNYVLQSISAADAARCKAFIKAILCQKCSPYAAHLYFAEATLMPSSFPSICNDYFAEFRDVCGNLLPHLTTTLPVPAGDPNYCYPDILNSTNGGDSLGDLGNQGSCKQLCVKEVASGLYSPTAAKPANDGTHRFFVAEQRGVVWVFLHNFTKLSTPFVDIRDEVYETGRRFEELGLLDIAFHPDFRSNRKFYLFYTVRSAGQVVTRVSEFTVLTTDMNRADVASEKVIIEIDQFANNHNGGSILFKNGLLYIFTGDGGGANDPRNNGQDKQTLLGKALRVNVNEATDDDHEYVIPPDNPFVDDENARSEIFAYGLRNPWRCTLDRGDPVTGRGRGRIFCGDVGQNRMEEVDIITKGSNYGWNCYEGTNRFRACQRVENYVPPIATYSHKVGQSITGGYVYRGCVSPNLNGKYIFGDWSNGRLFYLEQQNNVWVQHDVCIGSSDVCVNDDLSSSFAPRINSFAEDESGEVYILSTSNPRSTSSAGHIYRLVDPSRRGNPDKCKKTIVEVVISPSSPSPATTTEPRVQVRIRPANSRRRNIGVVEVRGPDGTWGGVCRDGWNRVSAGVFCRQLRQPYQGRLVHYKHGISVKYRTSYGTPANRFWLANLSCRGREKSIFDCSHRGFSQGYCGSTLPASVYCYARRYVPN